MSEEDQVKFEAELAWCLEKLQASLESGKLSPKQVDDAAKTYKLLVNPKTAYIKKRQLMRTTFGDYRVKMEKDEEKFKLGKFALSKTSMGAKFWRIGVPTRDSFSRRILKACNLGRVCKV